MPQPVAKVGEDGMPEFHYAARPSASSDECRRWDKPNFGRGRVGRATSQSYDPSIHVRQPDVALTGRGYGK